MHGYRRTVQEQGEVFIIDEDLCTACRAGIYLPDEEYDETDIETLIAMEGRRMPRGSGSDS